MNPGDARSCRLLPGREPDCERTRTKPRRKTRVLAIVELPHFDYMLDGSHPVYVTMKKEPREELPTCRATNDCNSRHCTFLRDCALPGGGAHPVVDHRLATSAAVLRPGIDAPRWGHLPGVVDSFARF